MEGVGEAGRIFKVEGLDLPDYPVSDGNSGHGFCVGTCFFGLRGNVCCRLCKQLYGRRCARRTVKITVSQGLRVHECGGELQEQTQNRPHAERHAECTAEPRFTHTSHTSFLSIFRFYIRNIPYASVFAVARVYYIGNLNFNIENCPMQGFFAESGTVVPSKN